MLATVRPRDIAGKTRRRMAAEELADLVAVEVKLKKIQAELKAAVQQRGSRLMQIHGVGPAGAARTLADAGDVARFTARNRFVSWTGTAPMDASSGEQVRHRLSRAGNRRMNHVLHVAAIVQLRHDTEGRAYYRRKLAAGKTPLEALRCLKRRLSDVVYRQLVADADTAEETGPGGHCGFFLALIDALALPAATDPIDNIGRNTSAVHSVDGRGPCDEHAFVDSVDTIIVRDSTPARRKGSIGRGVRGRDMTLPAADGFT
jgi:transposase IS116/IS110/IS902 family protein